MRTSNHPILVTLFWIIPFLAGAASAEPPKDLVSFDTPKLPKSIMRGKTESIALVFSVKSGFHVQANPASETYLIPTELRLDDVKGVVARKPVYPSCAKKDRSPSCKAHLLAGAKKAIDTYEGKFEILVPVEVAADAPVGKRSLSGKLRYQACNEQNCFFPTSLPVSVPVSVVAP